MDDDRYLWDRAGLIDPEIAELEELLQPLAHSARPLAFEPRARPPMHPLLAIAASILMAATMAFATGSTAPRAAVAQAPGHVPLRVVGAPGHLAAGTWFTATETRKHLALGHLGAISLDAGSRLKVARLASDETRLFLERGGLEARVSGAARPRFFQVATPATLCVDLGCRYTLKVDDAGNSVVRVKTGRVAFENGGREVYVPAYATCVARRGRGPGTPRFEDGRPELAAALDLFDEAERAPSAERRARANAVLALVREPKDALPAWHLLQDRDPAIVIAARAALDARFGHPEGISVEDTPGPMARQLWKRHLGRLWRQQRAEAEITSSRASPARARR